jgi:hypothetical protein
MAAAGALWSCAVGQASVRLSSAAPRGPPSVLRSAHALPVLGGDSHGSVRAVFLDHLCLVHPLILLSCALANLVASATTLRPFQHRRIFSDRIRRPE